MKSNPQIIPLIWTNEWISEILNSFNVKNEPEWDICDCCHVPTHIYVAKWALIDDVTTLLCKQCQNKYYANYF